MFISGISSFGGAGKYWKKPEPSPSSWALAGAGDMATMQASAAKPMTGFLHNA
jgi:hypothetical protein